MSAATKARMKAAAKKRARSKSADKGQKGKGKGAAATSKSKAAAKEKGKAAAKGKGKAASARRSAKETAPRASLLAKDGVRALHTTRAATGAVFQVASVRRYVVDPSFPRLVDMDTGTRYAFDVVLHDQKASTRVVLSPALNGLVFRGELCATCCLQVQDYHVRAEDTLTQTRRIVVIKDARVLPTRYETMRKATLPLLPDIRALDRRVAEPETPLAGNRELYLPMYSDDAMDDVDGWAKYAVRGNGDDAPPALEFDDATYVHKDHPGLDVATADGGVKWPEDDPARGMLVGRVGNVSRLVHFGRPHKKQSCAYKFSFELWDSSRSVTVVVWNKAAAKLHPAMVNMSWGALVAVSGYRAKTYMSSREVSVNHINPAGDVVLLPDDAVVRQPRDRYPVPALNFVSTRRFQALHAGATFDFVGLVSRVGPIVREPFWDGQSGDRNTFGSDPLAGPGVGAGPAVPDGPWFEYRWVWLRDDSTDRELVVKVYANSRPAWFRDGIVLGRPLALTQLHCVTQPDPDTLPVPSSPVADKEAASAAAAPRFAVASEFTTVVGGQDILRMVRGTARVRKFVDWFKASARTMAKRSEHRLANPEGVTYESMFVRPATLRMYCVLVMRSVKYVPPVPLAEVQKYVDALHVRQLRRILVVGQVVEYQAPGAAVKRNADAAAAGVGAKAVKAKGAAGAGAGAVAGAVAGASAGAMKSPVARRTRSGLSQRNSGAKPAKRGRGRGASAQPRRSRRGRSEDKENDGGALKRTRASSAGARGGKGKGKGKAARSDSESEGDSESSGESENDGDVSDEDHSDWEDDAANPCTITIGAPGDDDEDGGAGAGAGTGAGAGAAGATSLVARVPIKSGLLQTAERNARPSIAFHVDLLGPTSDGRSKKHLSAWLNGRRLAFCLALFRHSGHRTSVTLDAAYDLTPTT